MPRGAGPAKPKGRSDGAVGFIDVGVARVGASEQRATIASPSAVELRLELGGGVVLQC